jgi:glycosyltransferase involved in cell wall biosynthesis
MYINPIVMALMIIWCIYKNRQTIGVIDLIDAHFFYPDGVAAAIVASVMSKPFLITARGSDINVFPQFCIPRLLIRWAIKKSAALITVSRALKNKLIELGAHEGHIHVLQNGVDTHLFSVIDNNIKLEHIDKKDSFILSVGNLVEEKGHIYTLRAVAKLPEYKLVLIGEGKQEDVLRREAEQLGISDRVIFIPFLKQADLVHYYNQASVLVLASTREGMPNVVLEALACGTPVVASAVGGVPEIILDKQVGALFTPRAVDEIVRCIKEMPGKSGDSAYIHQYARGFSWENTINQLEQLFNDVKSVDAKSRIKT